MLASDYTTLLLNTADAEIFADSFIALLSVPRFYISELTVNMLGIPSADVTAVLGLELGDHVQVDHRPNNVGNVVSYGLTIEGISHTATPGTHMVTFKMGLGLTVRAPLLGN